MPEEYMNEKMFSQRPKNTNEGPRILIIVLVCAIFFGAIGYILGSQKAKQPEQPITQAVSIEEESSPSPEVATDNEISSWKTYTSDTYGFSFKYPKDWVVAETDLYISVNSPENEVVKTEIDAQFRANPEGGYGEGYGPTIMIQTFNSVSDYVNPGNPQTKSTQTLVEYTASQAQGVKGISGSTTLGGQKAYEYEAGGFSGIYYNIVVEHRSKVYSAQIISDKKSLTNTEKSILSTFQFTK